jgi:hypothetical protein
LGLLAPPIPSLSLSDVSEETYPLSQWYQQSDEILINLNTKCSNSAFDAQGSRVITVVLHVGTGKLYVAGGKMKDRDKTQFITKI